jgi:hypothetical protein
MGFMDKVKAQAEQAVAKAQQGVAQGQSKVEELQAKRQAEKLLRDLGAAVYAHQRTGGSDTAVNAVLQNLDAWVAEHGPLDTTPSTDTLTTPGPAEPAMEPPPLLVADTPSPVGDTPFPTASAPSPATEEQQPFTQA